MVGGSANADGNNIFPVIAMYNDNPVNSIMYQKSLKILDSQVVQLTFDSTANIVALFIEPFEIDVSSKIVILLA